MMWDPLGMLQGSCWRESCQRRPAVDVKFVTRIWIGRTGSRSSAALMLHNIKRRVSRRVGGWPRKALEGRLLISVESCADPLIWRHWMPSLGSARLSEAELFVSSRSLVGR